MRLELTQKIKAKKREAEKTGGEKDEYIENDEVMKG